MKLSPDQYRQYVNEVSVQCNNSIGFVMDYLQGKASPERAQDILKTFTAWVDGWKEKAK
jgi:Asp-tRNA(Asn)/Glu-tRNA(Gln) amidotransferase B subunit